MAAGTIPRSACVHTYGYAKLINFVQLLIHTPKKKLLISPLNKRAARVVRRSPGDG